MADNNTLTDKSVAELKKVVRYVLGMMRTKIPGGKNTPTGPVFPDLAKAKQPLKNTPAASGGVDVYNDDIIEVEQTPFIDLKGNGSENILKFSPKTISGSDGVAMAFDPIPSDDYQVLQSNGGNIVWDYPRAHS